MEAFGQLLWFLHAVLLFEAKNDHQNTCWLDLPFPKTKTPLLPCTLFWSEGDKFYTN
jgi:hypothetical protein